MTLTYTIHISRQKPGIGIPYPQGIDFLVDLVYTINTVK